MKIEHTSNLYPSLSISQSETMFCNIYKQFLLSLEVMLNVKVQDIPDQYVQSGPNDQLCGE